MYIYMFDCVIDVEYGFMYIVYRAGTCNLGHYTANLGHLQ